MSMIYCHEHDRHVDTDFHEGCPDCLEAASAVEELTTAPINTVELIHPDEPVEGLGAWSLGHCDYALCAYYIGPEEHRKISNERRTGWHVIYETNTLRRALEDALSFTPSRFYRYGIRVNPEDKTDA